MLLHLLGYPTGVLLMDPALYLLILWGLRSCHRLSLLIMKSTENRGLVLLLDARLGGRMLLQWPMRLLVARWLRRRPALKTRGQVI